MKQQLALLAACLPLALLWAAGLRTRHGAALGMLIAVLALLLLRLANPAFAAIEWHQLMHASIVYDIGNGRLPPENALLAGQALKYPWAHHYLVERLMALSHGTPAQLFAALNLAALLAMLALLSRSAVVLAARPAAGAAAVVFGVLGASPVFHEFARFWLRHAYWLDERMLPLHKFAHANSNGLGACAFVAFLYGALRLSMPGQRPAAPLAGMAAATLAALLLYPIAWTAVLAAACGIAAAQLTFDRTPAALRRVVLGAAAVALGSALGGPYLAQIGFERNPAAALALDLGIGRRPLALLAASALPLVLLALDREGVRRRWQARRSECLVLLGAAAGLAPCYLLLSLPQQCHYKYLMLYMLTLGVLAAPSLADAARRRPRVAVLALTALLMPTAWQFYTVARLDDFDERLRLHEGRVEYAQASARELAAWVATQTPRDAVLVDSRLSLAALGRRALYVGRERGPGEARPWSTLNGWTMPAPTMLVEVFGESGALVKQRLADADVLLLPPSLEAAEQAAARIAAEMGGRPVLVVVRDPAARLALEPSRALRLGFENADAAVYAVGASP